MGVFIAAGTGEAAVLPLPPAGGAASPRAHPKSSVVVNLGFQGKLVSKVKNVLTYHP